MPVLEIMYNIDNEEAKITENSNRAASVTIENGKVNHFASYGKAVNFLMKRGFRF